MGYARYHWGGTKADYIKVTRYLDLPAQSSAPTAAVGRVYMDYTYTLKICADGTSWTTVTRMTPPPYNNPPAPYKGTVYMDTSYKLRVCEDGSTFKTVTTS